MQQTINSFLWGFVERFSTQITQFLLGVILARILSPEDFGIYGLLAVFIAVGQTFVDSGFSNALVRKLDRTEIDNSTTFVSNVVISIIVYFVVFCFSPYIASFFKQEILNSLLRLTAICLIIDSLTIIQITKLTIDLNFKKLALITFVSALLSGIIGIILALKGLGVWSLAYKHLFDRFCIALFLWITSKWKPTIGFSYKSFKYLFGFGSKLMMSGLLNTLYLHISTILVGKFYSPATLGFYSRGEQFASLPGQNISAVMKKVTYPILSLYQQDDYKMISIYRKYISYSSLLIFFLLSNIAALAKPIVQIVLTERWNDAIIFVQLFTLSYMFNHISDINLNLLQVKGRSDLYLRIEFIKKSISFILLFAAIPFGVIYIALSRIIYTQIALIINTYYTGKLFGVGYKAQFHDFSPFLICSLVACAPSFIIVEMDVNNIFCLLVGPVLSIAIYWMLLKNNKYLCELINMAKNYVCK